DRGGGHLEVAAVALAEQGAFDVGGFEFAAVEDDGSGFVDDALRHVERAFGSFGESEGDDDVVFSGGQAQSHHLGGVHGEGGRAVAQDVGQFLGDGGAHQEDGVAR